MRRILVRFATGMLVFVIGPAGAWETSGLNGLLAYILLHTISRYVLAEFSSDSQSRALRFYKAAPLLLLFGASTPFILPGWEAQVVLVAIFFGCYEGAYWTTFHDVRRAVSEVKGESEEDSIDWFHFWEVIAAFFGALLVYHFGSEAGLIGAVLAFAAWVIPYDQLTGDTLNPEAPGIGRSTDDTGSGYPLGGKMITGSYGMLGLAVSSAMRIVSLNAGGIDFLAIIVGAFSLIGYTAKKLLEVVARYPIASDIIEHYSEHPAIVGDEELSKAISLGVIRLAIEKKAMMSILKKVKEEGEGPKVNEIQKKSEAIDYVSWILAHWAILLGVFVMFWSVMLDLNSLLTPLAGPYLSQKPYFLIGYAIYVLANSGVLRPLEIRFADDLLKGGEEIGRREREKFTKQAQMVFVFSIAWIILSGTQAQPTLDWVVYSALIWASFCAMANLIYYKFHQKFIQEGDPFTALT